MFGNYSFDDAFVALVHLVAKHPTFSILSSRFSPHNYRRAVYSDIIFSEIVTSLLQDFISVFLAFFPVHFLFQVVNFVFVNTFKLAPSFFWPQRISLGFCAKKCSVQMINASDVKERIQASTLCSFSDYDYADNHKITICSIVIGLKISHFTLIYLPSCYRTVPWANHIQSCSLNHVIINLFPP